MEQRTVHLFVFDTFADWEPVFAIAEIHSGRFAVQPGRYRVKTVGSSMAPVVSFGGVTVLPDMVLADLTPPQSAMLILPGSDAWVAGKHTEALEKAQTFLAAGVPVAAICGATVGLARAGILDDRQHTSDAPVVLQATNYQGAPYYRDEPAVTGGDLITAGGTAPLEFAYHILKRLGVYDTPTLDAWYGLYKTGEPQYFFALQQRMMERNAA